MKRIHLAAACAAALGGVSALGAVAAAIPSNIAAAVANPNRPPADRSRDAARKPGEVVAFAGVKPGEKVLELIPGGGYFTRILSVAVGPSGHVTEGIPNLTGTPDVAQRSNGVAADPNFSNVSEARFTVADLDKLGPVDLVWTSQNYHDLHLTRFNLDLAAFDRAVYADLKPGGIFFIEDHAARPGDTTAPDKLHRIDEDIVKREVEGAGFKLIGESNLLRNPADDHTVLVFKIHDHTDQFLLKFQKPR